jgi:isoleucyl-tRNA synthetase
MAEWPKRDEAGHTSDEWMFLREVRDTVNAAIEPLRAAKTLATTAEAEVTLTAPKSWTERLSAYGDELPALLIVAAIELVTAADGAEPKVEVAKTTKQKCDRCWMFRSDVRETAPETKLCGRCTKVLSARS